MNYSLVSSPAAARSETVRWSGLLRCELVKLTSLRATRWTLLALAVLIVGGGVAIAAGSPTAVPGSEVRSQDVAAAFSLPLSGTVLARALVAAVGVVAATGDLTTGMTRTTLLAAPRRGRLLLAKAGVVAGLSALICAPAVVVAWLIGNAILGRDGLNSPLNEARVWLALAANVAVLVGLALVGFATGILLRSAAAAICAVLGAILVVPVVLQLLPAGGFTEALRRWWLTETVTNAVDVATNSDALPAAAGLLTFAAWAVLLSAAAALSFTTRTP